MLYSVKEQIKVNQFSLLLRTNKWSSGKGSGLQSMVTEFNSRRSHFGARKGFIVNYTVLKKDLLDSRSLTT